MQNGGKMQITSQLIQFIFNLFHKISSCGYNPSCIKFEVNEQVLNASLQLQEIHHRNQAPLEYRKLYFYYC